MRHVLETSLQLPLHREEVFPFFTDAFNLERITPPQLRFGIVTPAPIQMKAGALIDYRMSLFGVPFSWRTVIPVWEPPCLFVDEQISGPYRRWVHTHRFIDEGDVTRICDHVEYELPLRPIGEIAWPLVRRQLDGIFRFRDEAIRSLFAGGTSRR